MQNVTRPIFNPVIQYLVACGYGVFVPNVRGSTGYGYEYQSLDDVRLRMDSVADLQHAALYLHKVNELLSVLAQPTAEMATLRALLHEQGSFPSRRTWERRLKAIPQSLPAQIGCLGRHLVELIQPWASAGRAVAIDSTILHARGGSVASEASGEGRDPSRASEKSPRGEKRRHG